MAEKIAILAMSLVVSVAMCICVTRFVKGSEITKSGGSASSVVVLNVEPATVSCNLPTDCKNCELENLSNFPVLLKSIMIYADDKWTEIIVNKEVEANSSIDVSEFIAPYRVNNETIRIECSILI